VPEDAIARYARRAATTPRLDATEAARLAASAQRGGVPARTALMAAQRRMVAVVAKQYGLSGCPPEDLLRLGEAGLEQAIDRYRDSSGSFSTYATWHIRQAITRGLGGPPIAH
jgi:DNA-directed RNA polymerase sigma subunit (sigma70/sigma32)